MATTEPKQRVTRALHQLTARAAAAATDGKHNDGGGLYLVIKGARRRWVLLYTVPDGTGRRREMGLGAAGEGGVSLKTARDEAAKARDHLARGIDPLAARDARREAEREAAAEAERVKARRKTFAEWAERYVAIKESGWKNAKHVYQWRATLLNDAATLGPLPIDTVTRADVLAALEPIWTVKPETATRLRARIERVMEAAIAAGDHPGPNPAIWQGGLKPLLPPVKPKSKRVVHQRALPFGDVPAFIAALRDRQAEGGAAALAAEFTALTAARSGEVLGATWREIDLRAAGGARWTVPADRMKAGVEHMVPLTARAITLLEQARPLTGGAPDVPLFPSPRLRDGHPVTLSDMAMLQLLKRMGWHERTTIHGLRSAFRVWAAETTSHPREVAEAALAHQNPDKVEKAYLRTDHMTRRRKLMDQWAGWIERGLHKAAQGGGAVVPFGHPPSGKVTA